MSVEALKSELATANRILFHYGVVDAFGHISARHPDRPDHYLLARNMAPARVNASDVMLFGPDDEPVADDRRPYLERFIHGAIYRARPDVHSVVHSHSPAVIPFGVVAGAQLRPIFHMCGFLGAGAARFEIRDVRGDATDLLIRDHELGAALARALGSAEAVLMRGHGSTVVADSVRLAVYRAIYAEANARLQCQAMTMGGEITFLTEAEAAASAESNKGQLARAWDMWAAQVAAK
ncbi:MAG: class II aldolase/adducin family protein [Acetobacteraceae bacterium]|nr:class II aldolase/adducin family protein [Acetobacteraceae bacterium]